MNEKKTFENEKILNNSFILWSSKNYQKPKFNQQENKRLKNLIWNYYKNESEFVRFPNEIVHLKNQITISLENVWKIEKEIEKEKEIEIEKKQNIQQDLFKNQIEASFNKTKFEETQKLFLKFQHLIFYKFTGLLAKIILSKTRLESFFNNFIEDILKNSFLLKDFQKKIESEKNIEENEIQQKNINFNTENQEELSTNISKTKYYIKILFKFEKIASSLMQKSLFIKQCDDQHENMQKIYKDFIRIFKWDIKSILTKIWDQNTHSGLDSQQLLSSNSYSHFPKFLLTIRNHIKTLTKLLPCVGVINDMLFVFNELVDCPDSGEWGTDLLYFPSIWDYENVQYFLNMITLLHKNIQTNENGKWKWK
ncbi:hypothetical protein M0811_03810 [Anaeramoeba ignava]|uniref:Uncharacterized protein n=1 Tax=Anaeramoeba ignava TaxID=1746090 RepID=A0A9Q0LYT4_ANAIG|nr:hypothetical protein M0811_03810 [Anaeramoeba ignava]